MPVPPNKSAVTFRVTATGTIAVVNKASATGVLANAAIVGVLFHATVGATAASVQVFATATATATAAALTGQIVPATGAASYLEVPAYSPSGIGIICTGGANPDITLFWNPAA